MKKVFIFLCLLFCLSGCATFKIPGLGSKANTQTTKDYEQTELRIEGKYPKELDIMDEEVRKIAEAYNGKLHYKTIKKSSEKIVPEKTAWQKFKVWAFSTVGMIIIIGLILIATGNGWVIISTVKNARKFKKALKETVKGIKDANAVQKGNMLYNTLSSTQDKDTKALIDDIKAEL